ncbi:MAG: NAD(P)-dependent oxidoreductase, partial [Alphaproteobacteria bacterium]|nr:NAD(P)-dependent oxidoreductase [Alphaproteobacteria bacterium]
MGRCVILGGSGFIGTELSKRLLAADHEVTVVDIVPASLPGVRYVPCDVRNLEILKVAVQGHEVMYNLAAAHRDDVRPVSLYHEVNVDGARNSCLAAEAAGIQKIVFTSSVAVYGESPNELTEDSPHNYINEYGRTKSLAENEYRAWQAADAGRSLTILRPTVVFGPGNRGNVYNLIKQIRSGLFLMVGDGDNRKSMAYVGNISDFLAFASAMPPGQLIVNYADKPDFDMLTLVRLVRGAYGKSGTGLRISASAASWIGRSADLVAKLLHVRLPVSSVRI